MTRTNRKKIGWLLLIGSIIAMAILGNKQNSPATPDTGALPAAWVEGMTDVILVACLIAGISLLVTRGKSKD